MQLVENIQAKWAPKQNLMYVDLQPNVPVSSFVQSMLQQGIPLKVVWQAKLSKKNVFSSDLLGTQQKIYQLYYDRFMQRYVIHEENGDHKQYFQHVDSMLKSLTQNQAWRFSLPAQKSQDTSSIYTFHLSWYLDYKDLPTPLNGNWLHLFLGKKTKQESFHVSFT